MYISVERSDETTMNVSTQLSAIGCSETVVKFCKRATILTESEGRIGVKIVRFELMNKVFYLKHADDWLAVRELRHERLVLETLLGRMDVPIVAVYEESAHGASLVTESLEGVPAHMVQHTSDLTSYLLATLETIRGLDMGGVKMPVGVEREIADIAEFVHAGEIDCNKFAAANDGCSPTEVLAELTQMQTEQSIDVFTHGDLCLPNLLVGNMSIGVIDWGKAGWGDPMRDICSTVTSVRRNAGEKEARELWDLATVCLGSDLDRKARFYSKIDQFFYARRIKPRK